MASQSDIALVQARFVLPFLIESGARNTISVPIVGLNGASIAASFTRTFTLVKPDGTSTVLDTTTGVMTVTTTQSITYDDPGTLALGLGYGIVVEFAASGVSRYKFRNDAAIVRANLACPIGSADVYAVVSSLNPSNNKPIHGLTTLDGYVSEAWTRIQRRLIENGNRPNLVMSPSAFHDVAVLLTLALVFEDFSTRLNAAYMEQARMYREQYETAWQRLSFTYADGDGTTAAGGKRRGSSPVLFVGTSRGVA